MDQYERERNRGMIEALVKAKKVETSTEKKELLSDDIIALSDVNEGFFVSSEDSEDYQQWLNKHHAILEAFEKEDPKLRTKFNSNGKKIAQSVEVRSK